MSSQTNNNDSNVNNGSRTQRRRKRAFLIPTNTRQFQTCMRRLSLKCFSCLFFIADHAMYLLGPILIVLASVIIAGLTYVYFCVVLPMLSGTNWIASLDDYHAYKTNNGVETTQSNNSSNDISTMQSILIALATPSGILHTAIVAFFLINIIYNYYRCVTTSNSGQVYDSVVRELASVTNFTYPESEEELIQCKRELERKIAAKLECRRRELLAAQAATTSTTADQTNGTAANTTQQRPTPIPRIHAWQLLTPTEWSYCRYSKQPKPPRSHYDHVTKSLVLNMDHYCPWMFNCVGYLNYRYFVNFLVFTTCGLFYGAGICCRPFLYLGGVEYREQVKLSSGGSGGTVTQAALRGAMGVTVRHLRSNSYIPTPDERTVIALGFMICLCLGCAVGCLLGFHLYLTCSAQTTIEFHGNWARRRKVKGWKNPYSAGSWKRNWEMIYGTRYHFQNDYLAVENGDDDSIHQHENNHSYVGCWGMFKAMMPSKREPEFLPFPIDGVLIRRKNRVNASVVVGETVDEEMPEGESCPGLHLSVDYDDDDDADDLIAVFKKKSPSQTTTDSLIHSSNSNGLTARTGRNLPRGEEQLV